MELEVKIDQIYLTPKVIIYTKEMTQEVMDLVKRLSEHNIESLIGYRGDEILIIPTEEIYRIYAGEQKVYVKTLHEEAYLKARLYEIEEKFAGSSLVRISNSEIVNFKKVKSLDLSISGTISMKLESGEKTFVSRRYVDKIKKYLGIWG